MGENGLLAGIGAREFASWRHRRDLARSAHGAICVAIGFRRRQRLAKIRTLVTGPSKVGPSHPTMARSRRGATPGQMVRQCDDVLQRAVALAQCRIAVAETGGKFVVKSGRTLVMAPAGTGCG